MIIFVRVPSFYAAVEQADAREARPVIVGGDPEKGACVISATPDAELQGVLQGMSLQDAQELCPEAVLCTTRLARYRQVAADLRALLRDAVDTFESVGLDGAYVQPRPGVDPVGATAELIVRIKAELGLCAVGGVGPTRFVAFTAARHPGETGIRRVAPDEVLSFLGALPIGEIWGLGPQTEEKLARGGISRIRDLQKRDLGALAAIVGRRNAAAFLELAMGRDKASLRPSPRAKSLSREQTLADPTGDLRTLGDAIGRLAGGLEQMLAREARAARTISLGVTYDDGQRETRAITRERGVVATSEIAELGRVLLGRTHAGMRDIRRLRLQVTRLTRREEAVSPRQLRLL